MTRKTAPHPISACLALAAALSVTAGPAHAQFGGGMGGLGGGMGGRHEGRQMERGRERQPAPAIETSPAMEVEQQLENLHYQLRLKPDQESLWAGYREKVGALVEDQTRPGRDERAAGGSAVQQIGRRVDQARNRMTALEDIADAAQRLYAALDDRQKGLADRLMATTVPAAAGQVPMPQARSGAPGSAEFGTPPRRD
jgi:Spy/CpxP family protein refolding chaperone